MADSDLLTKLTANVAPVTDNYPSRISPQLVMTPSFDETYDLLMDEDARRERFTKSPMINQQWPAELVKKSDRFFEYERLIKNKFTGGVYRREADPYLWESIDNLLMNTSLTTLPLWLLESDHDIQSIIAGQIEQDGYRVEFALELARKYAAERNYETALMYAFDYVQSSQSMPESASKLYIYLLQKNGHSDQARATIKSLRAVGRRSIDEFIDWFESKFGPSSIVSVEPPTSDVQRIVGVPDHQ